MLKAVVERHCCPPTLAEVTRPTLWRPDVPAPRGYRALCRRLRRLQRNVNSFIFSLVKNCITASMGGENHGGQPSPDPCRRG